MLTAAAGAVGALAFPLLVSRVRASPYSGYILIGSLFLVSMFRTNLPGVSLGPFSVFPSDAVFAVITVAATINMLQHTDRLRSPLALLWIVFGCSLLVSIVRGFPLHGSAAIVSAREFFYFWSATLYGMSFQYSKSQLQHLLNLLTILGVTLGTLVTVRLITDSVGLSDFNRFGGGTPFRVIPASGASVLSLYLMYTLGQRAGYGAKQSRWIFLWLILLIIILQHRTVWFSTSVALIWVTIFNSAIRTHLRTPFILMISLISLVSVFGTDTLLSSLGKSWNTAIDLSSGTGYDRIEGWKKLLEKWYSGSFMELLFGLPFGESQSRVIQVERGVYKLLPFSAHNMYVQTIFYTGITGIISLVASLSICIKKGIVLSANTQHTLPYVMVAMLMSIVTFGLAYQFTYVHGLFLGLAIALIFHSTEAVSEELPRHEGLGKSLERYPEGLDARQGLFGRGV